MTVSVLIPTYCRPVDLERCLGALILQQRIPDAVFVVCRPEDTESHAVLARYSQALALTVVHVTTPGVVAALNAGLERVGGDIVAITDDDAAPRSDWLRRIEGHFAADPRLGGVGGRDYVHGQPQPAECERVGVIEWFGRQIGNHHLGIGEPRHVDMLKGVNMSFRLAAIAGIRFDERLRGNGAQVHNELAFSLDVRSRGWLLLYDPAVAVDHYPAQRFDEDQRSQKSMLATSNAAFNETLTMLEHLPNPVKPVFLAWAVLIGARDLPGIVQAVRLALRSDPAWVRLPAVLHGRFAALRARYAPSVRLNQN